ncbi:hypothetical protein SARC_00622 [Sphaeroforma arctica JP610]|uniref:chitin synthase n=1 Tax=Sphaeroforma arctica JP610 TaxID=667725 RepID=A0A0L0GEC1_9EUKA|nr:hypothetical protein SARC_00622 [Sphaeroforma arctica JP610]KNC87236.1 hypothetical protein SARC_00622 [Sphaeroforma arctica JP610]|eukprot:XP_014161138.1 hypothetical protein SARC_00622 [Sphaeroforma arctica JP610]
MSTITLNKPKDKKLHPDLVWKDHTDDDTVYLTDEIEVEVDPSRWGRFKAATRRSGYVIASYGAKIGSVLGLVGGSEDDMRHTEVSMLKVRDDLVLSSAPAVKTQSVISQWSGLAPVQGGSYFTPRSKQRKLVVGVVVSFAGFTEGNRINTRTQLQRTLESLYDQEQQCHDLDVEFIYLAVMDGMPLADNDITGYISSTYNQQQWANNLRMQHDPRHVTIMQAKVSDAHEHDHGLVEVAPGKRLRMTTIIKGEPAGKVNSHEWFFSAYSSVYEVDYAFTTEIGTTYATSFMSNLINYLESHAHVSAVSGRQRVMSSTMQSLHTEGLTEMFYRAVQSYDQEARITNLQGAQTFVGMLPLICGAAGLWRMSDLEGEPLDYYLDYPKQITLDQGLRVGNLLLAADNVLSYAACLMTGKQTQWVPNAVFYTEAKLESQSFITQRKRWANGTMACYLIMLFNSFGDIFDGPHKLSFKLNVFLHMLLQMVVQAVTGVSPGLMAALAYFSAVEMNFGGDEYKMYVAYGVTAVNCILYVLFCAVHFHKRFSQFTYNIVIAWTIAVTLMVASSVIFMFAASNSAALAIFSVAVLLPSLLALLHSLDVFVIMTVSVFQYAMFLPVFTAWFSAYAYCRVWDVSEYDTLTIKGRAQKGAGLAIMLTVMALNIGVAAALIGLASLNRLMHLFLGVVGLTLIPQFMSLIYFLFYTEHCLTGSLRSVSFRWMAVASSVLYALTVVLLCVGCFTTSWLTNSVPVYIHANTTAVLNETRLQYEGPYMLMNETEVFDSIKGDSLASLASHSDLRVGGWDGRVINVNGTILEPEAESKLLGVHSYQTDTIITTSTIWRLDPVKAFETKLNLYHLKFTAYYVNDSTIVTDTANTTLDAHGTVLNTRTHRVAHFQRYLNFSYIDHNGDLQVSITDVSDRNYTNTYQMKTETNETLVLNSLQYTYGRYDGYVDLFYGLLFLELDFHTTTPYKSEALPWGGDLMSHYPGGSWAFCVLLVCGALVFLGMIAMATLFSFCANDQSRVHGVVIVFMWVIVIALLMCVFLFPASWGGMNTYHIGWWNPDNTNGTYLCGESTGIYNPGDCSVGWSYWMVVLAFVVAMFGYNSARYMLYKPAKQNADHRHLLTTRDVDPESYNAPRTVHAAAAFEYNLRIDTT